MIPKAEIKIRKIKRSDYKPYLKLRKESFVDHFKLTRKKRVKEKQIRAEFNNLIKNKKRIGLLISNASSAMGFITGTFFKNPHHKIGYLDDIFVKKEFRRKGYGCRLIEEFKKWAKRKGANKLRLGVRINNKNAIKMYQKIGFEIKYYEMDKKIK